MEKIDFDVEKREQVGKGPARTVRRAGKIPGVLYGGKETVSLTLDPMSLTKLLRSGAGESTLLNLKVQGLKGGEKGLLAILRDTQRDPVTGGLLHADFQEVSLKKPIRVWVHLEITGGTPIGVKADGGALQQTLREVEVECLPSVIPESLKVDVGQMNIQDSIHVGDLPHLEGVKVLTPPELQVVAVTPPISEGRMEEMLASAPEAGKEPEVIGKPAEGEEEAKKETKKEPKKES